jgi:hypothetical protein
MTTYFPKPRSDLSFLGSIGGEPWRFKAIFTGPPDELDDAIESFKEITDCLSCYSYLEPDGTTTIYSYDCE